MISFFAVDLAPGDVVITYQTKNQAMPSPRASAVATDREFAREEARRCRVVPLPVRSALREAGCLDHWRTRLRLPPRAKSTFKRGAGLTHPPRAIFFFNRVLFFRYNGAHPMRLDTIIPDPRHIAAGTVG